MEDSLIYNLPQVSGKTGWPWTIEVSTDIYLSKDKWPKISIVTPSFNQGRYIEETIRSILLQNYPNLEYIIIDGGSTDNTVEILKQYDKWITYWITEKDKGQVDAINKGIRKSTGEIFNWINSDDFLEKDALFWVASSFEDNEVICGNVINFSENIPDYEEVVKNDCVDFDKFLSFKSVFHQPGIWLDLVKLKTIGPLLIEYTYYFDRFLLLDYFFEFKKIKYIDKMLVRFRLHDNSKTILIQDDKWSEIIEFYNLKLKDRKYRKYFRDIKRALNVYLIPVLEIKKWQRKYYNKPIFIQLISYLVISFSFPKILLSRYYYTIFNKLFLKKKSFS